jgi:hypothetical protein
MLKAVRTPGSIGRMPGTPYSLVGRYRRSRRFSSRSMAARMKSARFSPSSRTASIRSSVPPGSLAGVCSWLICFLPMPKYR